MKHLFFPHLNRLRILKDKLQRKMSEPLRGKSFQESSWSRSGTQVEIKTCEVSGLGMNCEKVSQFYRAGWEKGKCKRGGKSGWDIPPAESGIWKEANREIFLTDSAFKFHFVKEKVSRRKKHPIERQVEKLQHTKTRKMWKCKSRNPKSKTNLTELQQISL